MSSSTLAFGASLRQHIAERLQRFDVRPIAGHGLRKAAVVMAIVPPEQGAQACFLLTRRALRIKRHSGQFALPGGRVDSGETDLEAALRELHEELGLQITPSAVLGRLDDFATRSGFRIRPYVAWVTDTSALTPDPREVAACFRVPVGALESAQIPRLHRIAESERPVLSVPLPCLGTEVFAPTAALLYQCREVALGGRATRVSHYEQPAFAWS